MSWVDPRGWLVIVACMSNWQLTYCGNVHPAESLEDWLATLSTAAVVKDAAQAQGRAFGLGVYWPRGLAERLATDPAAGRHVADELERLGLPVWTCNVFPVEGFHEEVVKERVYTPDWATEDRLLYTRWCAEAAAALQQSGAVVSMSTLPLGYRPPGEQPAELRRMARNLVRAASHLHGLRERTGVEVVLALEPEPFCLLERCGETADFLEQWVFGDGLWATVPEAVLRRHLGVCVDLCHLAVVDEEPLAAMADLVSRGIRVAKIQVSSCLEVRSEEGFEALWAYDEPRYLHQTVGRASAERAPPRALDLGDVRRREAEFRAALPVRTHFHVPLWWDDESALGSTQREVARVLSALAEGQVFAGALPLLEVETYTWPVLAEAGLADIDANREPLAARLCRELEFAADRLQV
jgi:sugar phosphate isomerase/epimerase